MALTVFKTVRDLTPSGWVGSIPMHSRQHATEGTDPVPRVGSRVLVAAIGVAMVIAAFVGRPLVAQQVDSAAARARRVTPAPTDSLVSPLSPRRAFFYSFLAPGYSQSVFGRNKTAVGFMLVEAIALSMIRESVADVNEARRSLNDTVVVSWIDDNGHALTRPDTAAIRFGDRELRSRRAHVEDWIAILVANHLFAGADAYVSAHLWDVPARVGFRMMPRGAALVASFKW